jgi:hypothetical protein
MENQLLNAYNSKNYDLLADFLWIPNVSGIQPKNTNVKQQRNLSE